MLYSFFKEKLLLLTACSVVAFGADDLFAGNNNGDEEDEKTPKLTHINGNVAPSKKTQRNEDPKKVNDTTSSKKVAIQDSSGLIASKEAEPEISKNASLLSLSNDLLLFIMKTNRGVAKPLRAVCKRLTLLCSYPQSPLSFRFDTREDLDDFLDIKRTTFISPVPHIKFNVCFELRRQSLPNNQGFVYVRDDGEPWENSNVHYRDSILTDDRAFSLLLDQFQMLKYPISSVRFGEVITKDVQKLLMCEEISGKKRRKVSGRKEVVKHVHLDRFDPAVLNLENLKSMEGLSLGCFKMDKTSRSLVNRHKLWNWQPFVDIERLVVYPGFRKNLPRFQSFKRLRELCFINSDLTGEEYCTLLPHLSELRELSISDDPETVLLFDGLVSLVSTKLPHLESLVIGVESAYGVRELRKLVHLKELRIKVTDDDCVKELSKLRQLRFLEIFAEPGQLTNDCAVSLGKMNNLETLQIGEDVLFFDQGAYSHLSKLTQLSFLAVDVVEPLKTQLMQMVNMNREQKGLEPLLVSGEYEDADFENSADESMQFSDDI